MGRRANGEGSIYQRADGRWAASISIGRGKRKHFLARSRKEAAAKLTEALKAQQDGLPLVTERQTFGAFALSWLETARPSLKPRTWIRYEQLLRVHALPDLRNLQLTKLTPQHLQRLYADVRVKGISAATIRQLHAVIHRGLRQACQWNLVPRNVADLVTLPRIERLEMQVLSPEQSRRLLEGAHGDRLEALYVLALTAGMRQGEILALRWRDVDLDHGTVNVHSTLYRLKGTFLFAEPKTPRSRRQIVMTEAAKSALRRHRIAQAEERLRSGSQWKDEGLVFTNLEGSPIDASNLLRHCFHPLLAAAGLPKVRFHDLRHTAATLLLGQGVHAKIVSEMLGHSNIAITMDLYSHVTPTMQREAARALDNLLSP